MKYIWTSPTSASQLRKYANSIRKLLNCTDKIAFPILEILDYLMDEGVIIFQILDDNDSYFEENTIYAKEAVYREAIAGIGRSRFTLTHELAHFILLRILNFEIFTMDQEPLPFQDPEWQANTLASEILIPFNLTKDFSLEEVMEKCLVSEECALVNYDKKRRNR